MNSDERLARLVFEGSRGAFSILFERYHAPLSRYCRSIVHNPDDSADAFQNTMLAALAGLEREPPRGPLKPWLYRIAHNESINLLRRRRDNEDLVADIGERGDGTVEVEIREQLRSLFIDLKVLPERQRGALMMRELSGLEYDEIAKVLNTSTVAARKLVYEARVSLNRIEAGRSTSCEEIQLNLSGLDGRTARARKVRAHLDTCPACAAFAAAIDARGERLVLIPALPLAAAGATFTGLIGAGAGHTLLSSVVTGRAGRVGGAAAATGAGAVGSGSALSGAGGALAMKCLAVCGALVVAGGGALAVSASPNAKPAHHQAIAAVPLTHHAAAHHTHGTARTTHRTVTGTTVATPQRDSAAHGTGARVIAAPHGARTVGAAASQSVGADPTAKPTTTVTPTATTPVTTVSTPEPSAPAAATTTTASAAANPGSTQPTASTSSSTPTSTYNYSYSGTSGRDSAASSATALTTAMAAATSAVASATQASTSAWTQTMQSMSSAMSQMSSMASAFTPQMTRAESFSN